MTQRQHRETLFRVAQVQHLEHRLDVAPDVVMREHHALGVPGGAGGVDQRRQGVGRDGQGFLLEVRVPVLRRLALRFEVAEECHARSCSCALERHEVLQGGQMGLHLHHLRDLLGGGAEHAHRAGIAEDVLDLFGGERGVDGDVHRLRAQACEVGERPLHARLREDRHPVAWLDPQLAQPDRLLAGSPLGVAVRDGLPGAADLGPVRARQRVGIPSHGLEKQLGQRPLLHGRNPTTKVIGEPGTMLPSWWRAVAVITIESGRAPPVYRTCTTARPPLVVRIVSLGTKVSVVVPPG